MGIYGNTLPELPTGQIILLLSFLNNKVTLGEGSQKIQKDSCLSNWNCLDSNIV